MSPNFFSTHSPLNALNLSFGSRSPSAGKSCRGVCSLSKKENNNIEFIYQFLLSYEKNWVSLEQGSTFTAVSGNDTFPCIKYIPLFVLL
jgi:hypothetical protein